LADHPPPKDRAHPWTFISRPYPLLRPESFGCVYKEGNHPSTRSHSLHQRLHEHCSTEHSDINMKPFAQLSSLVLALLPVLVAGVITPRYLQRAPFTRRDLNVTSVETELGALLSPNATILGPGDPSFANTTVRYSTYAVPDIEVVVVPGIESDVAVTVRAIRRQPGRPPIRTNKETGAILR
jgi:hypothetical protein